MLTIIFYWDLSQRNCFDEIKLGINFIKGKIKVSKSFKKFQKGLGRGLEGDKCLKLLDSNVRECSHMSHRVLENLKVVFAQAETAFFFGLAFFGLLIFFKPVHSRTLIAVSSATRLSAKRSEKENSTFYPSGLNNLDGLIVRWTSNNHRRSKASVRRCKVWGLQSLSLLKRR